MRDGEVGAARLGTYLDACGAGSLLCGVLDRRIFTAFFDMLSLMPPNLSLVVLENLLLNSEDVALEAAAALLSPEEKVLKLEGIWKNPGRVCFSGSCSTCLATSTLGGGRSSFSFSC